MHGAPSVSYPVGRSRIADRLLLLLWICGACCAAAACLRLGKADWRFGAAGGQRPRRGRGGLGEFAAPRPASDLNFDGLHWSIPGAAGLHAADARVALDCQSWLLVRLAEPRRARRWVWLERRALPERWQDLRRAVYSRARSGRPGLDRPPVRARRRATSSSMTASPPPVPPDTGLTDAPAAAPRAGEVDFQLVQRTVAGDQKAFELLVIKYQRRIERLIGRMVRDVNLVEDIAQETFIRAYRALHQFRGEAQFYTWLYRIAVNTAKKALVDMKRDPTVTESALRSSSEDEDETYRPGNEPISDETPESVMAANEIAAAVEAAMEALPAELRQAVTLREIEGMSYEEIAEVMNCPIGTVRSRIFRAREAISARVKPLLDNQSGKRW